MTTPRRPADGLGRAQLLVGWNEYVDLPAWGITGLRAKMDTGARSSALHVENIEPRPGGRVRFDIVLDRKRRERPVRVEAPVVRRARVRSSTGQQTLRPIVVAHVRIGPVERDVEVSLIDRERMIFRMLLGRSALAGRLLVDVAHANLLERPRRRPAVKRRVR